MLRLVAEAAAGRTLEEMSVAPVQSGAVVLRAAVVAVASRTERDPTIVGRTHVGVVVDRMGPLALAEEGVGMVVQGVPGTDGGMAPLAVLLWDRGRRFKAGR